MSSYRTRTRGFGSYSGYSFSGSGTRSRGGGGHVAFDMHAFVVGDSHLTSQGLSIIKTIQEDDYGTSVFIVSGDNRGNMTLLVKETHRELHEAYLLAFLTENEARNVVTLHDHWASIGPDGLTYQFLLEECLTGFDRHTIPQTRAAFLTYSQCVLSALVDLHAANVAHLDLKPDNIMFDGERAVLIDFDCAKTVDATGFCDVDGPIGTDGYRAPETDEGSRCGVAADLYAFAMSARKVFGGFLVSTDGVDFNGFLNVLSNYNPSDRGTAEQWLDYIEEFIPREDSSETEGVDDDDNKTDTDTGEESKTGVEEASGSESRSHSNKPNTPSRPRLSRWARFKRFFKPKAKQRA